MQAAVGESYQWPYSVMTIWQDRPCNRGTGVTRGSHCCLLGFNP